MAAFSILRHTDKEALDKLSLHGLESLLPPMVLGGLHAFVKNETGCRMELVPLLVPLKDGILPLVINDGNSHDCYVSSPNCHYIKYAAQEVLRKGATFPKRLLTFAARPFLQLLCRACRFDRIVSLNNWMLPTNPLTDLSRDQIDALTVQLSETYPEHALVFRNVEPGRKQLFNKLRASGYSPVRNRLVYVWHPGRFANLPKKTRYRVRQDLRLLGSGPYQVLDGNRAWSSADIRQFQRLYNQLYILKHSRYNMQFSARWFRSVLNKRLTEVRAYSRNGRIDAFSLFIDEGDRITASIIGYDTEMGPETGLYRRTIACLIKEAIARNKPLFLSSGTGRFKELRGALPMTEYEMVYDRHLKRPQQAIWVFIRVLYDLAGKSNHPTGSI